MIGKLVAALRLMQIAVSSCRYRSTRSDAALRERLVELGGKKPRWFHRRLHILLIGSGERVNHKRAFRLYRKVSWCEGWATRPKAIAGGEVTADGECMLRRRSGQT